MALLLIDDVQVIYSIVGSTHRQLNDAIISDLAFLAETYVLPYAKLTATIIGYLGYDHWRVKAAYGASLFYTCYFCMQKIMGIDTVGFNYEQGKMSIDKSQKTQNLSKVMYSYRAMGDQFLAMIADTPYQDDEILRIRNDEAYMRGIFDGNTGGGLRLP